MRCCMQAGIRRLAHGEIIPQSTQHITLIHQYSSTVLINASFVLSFPVCPSTYSPQVYMLTVAPDQPTHTTLGTWLLWTSDQPDTGASSRQHTTLTTDIHAPGGIRTLNCSKRESANWRLRLRGHWDTTDYFAPLTILCPTRGPKCTSIGRAPKHLATLSTLRVFGRWCWLVDDPLSYHVITSLATVCLQTSAFVSHLQFISVIGNRPLRLDLCARPASVSKHITYIPPSEWRPNCEWFDERRAHC